MTFPIDGGLLADRPVEPFAGLATTPALTAGTPAKPVIKPASTQQQTPKPGPTPTPGQLAAGARLTAGQSVLSANGRFELRMQSDGNLVELDRTTNVVVWASHTAGSGATLALMQSDGNLVLYRGAADGAGGGPAVWSSGTASHAGAWLAVQNDGNLVIYPTGRARPGHDLWASGVPLAETPGALPPLPTQSAAADAQLLPSSGIGLFAPGAPELGIEQTPLAPGMSPYQVLQQQNIFAQPKLLDDTALLNANLAATPSLDRAAFGTRLANPVGTVYSLPIGTSVTVLDPTRLALLEQQRTELHAAETAPASQYKSSVATLSATIYQELEYAGTRQSVPDAKALAATIRARAPGDATFQKAVDDALRMYQGTLDAQGRNSAQLGKIDAAAAAGDWAQVRTLAAQQTAATVGADKGAAALGDITARGSVYLTYAGGDPHFAQAIKAGIADARQAVLIDKPVNGVLAAYRSGGALAAMKALAGATDPQTATPAQVAQILADARIQQLVKQVLHGLTSYDGMSDPPVTIIGYLAAACQHATESDQGKAGLGKQAVDRIAIDFVAEADGMPPDKGLDVFQNPRLMSQIFTDATGQGNASLGLAVAAQAQRYLNPIFASAALDGVRVGLDTLKGSVDSLDKQTTNDAAFLTVPLKDWGGDSTPAQQQQLIKTLLADNPADAKKLNDDGAQIAQMQETTDSVRMAVAAYRGELHGVTGFDVDAPMSFRSGQYNWSVANTPSVTKALAALPTLVGAGKPGSTAPVEPSTNTVWLQRSLRKVVEQMGTKLIANLASAGPGKLLTPGGAKLAQTVWKRANKTLGAVLYFQNGAYSLSEAADGGLSVLLTDGASGIRQDLAGVSYAMSATIPSDVLGSVRPGSGVTPLARGYEKIAAQLDELGLPKLASSGLKISIHLAMQDTSDLASSILGAVEAAQEFADGENWKGVGNVLNATGYAALLTGPGIDASELPAGATVLGLDAAGWTGIGALLVLAGAAIYTAADGYSRSHAYDGNDRQLLVAMGVQPDIAAQLAKHATAFSGAPPSAGPFLGAYFKHGHQSEQQMVAWLNGLTPHQADVIASAIKSFPDNWQSVPMTRLAQAFDDALLKYGVMPPIQLI
ncbi:hypothetical protein [Pandoraea thiooxydans]|nr:hypothetical protein [Pandoraea thiooxydans]